MQNIVSNQASELNEQSQLRVLMVNHTCVYIITLITIYFVYQLGTALVGSGLLMSTTIFPYGTSVTPKIGTWRHHYTSIFYTYSAGPVLVFAVGMIAKVVHALYWVKQPGYIRVFLNWIFLHSLNFFFGAICVGLVTTRGFGHGLLYGFQLSIAGRALLALGALILLIIAGATSIRYFLEHSPNEELVMLDNRNSRLTFLGATVVVPYLIGTSLMLALQVPHNTLVDTLNIIFMFIIIVPILSLNKLNVRFFLQPEPYVEYINWKLVIAAIGLVFLFRIGLANGISFNQ